MADCFDTLRAPLTVAPPAEPLCAPLPAGVPLDCAIESVDFDLGDFAGGDFG